MKRILSAWLACACLILGSGQGGCHSATHTPTAAREDRPLPEPFVDAFLKAEIEERGGELGVAGKAAASEDLAKQLDRTSCSLSLAPAATGTHELPALYRAAVPGTLVLSKIYYCDKCGRWHAPVSATAFAITADGACVTNYHVFRQVEAGTVVVVTDAWGKTYPVREVLAASRKDDAAIFRVDVGADRLTPLPLRAGLPTGSTVAVLSHPVGHFYSFSPGHVSRRVWRYRGMVGDMKELAQSDGHDETVDRSDLAKLTQVLEITADYGIGSSGGPVLDQSGNVVGMVSNTVPVYADPKERRSQQMNFHLCVPAESILKMVK
jgi:serine protease Do